MFVHHQAHQRSCVHFLSHQNHVQSMGRDFMVDEATRTLMAQDDGIVQDNGIKDYVIYKTRLATIVLHARIILKIKKALFIWEGFRRFTWKLSLLLMSALSLSLRAFKSTSGRMDGHPRVGMVVVGAFSWVVSRCMGRSIPRSDFSLTRLSDLLTGNSFLQNLQNMSFPIKSLRVQAGCHK